MTSPQLYTPGPCEPWPVKWPCDISTYSPELTGMALQAASELLYELSGQRFGLCRVALRPCREDCYGQGWPGWGNWYAWQWPGTGISGGGPQPYWYGGNWYNLSCGQCTSGCSCVAISETWLPGPVNSVVSVTVDGVELVYGQDYRIDDYRKLVRLGGEFWPWCNDLSQTAVTGTGTWQVVADFGEPVPTLGQMAVGEVACDFLRLFSGEDCALPNGITDLTRQGISMSFANTSTDLTQFYARFPLSYLFIKSYNPNGLMAKSAAYDIDGPDSRAVNTQ